MEQLQATIPKSDKIYQYSVFTAIANKIYDGNLTVKELKQKGNHGIGTFNQLNGEMVITDGIVYQILSDGTIRQPSDLELIPFTVAAFYDEDFKQDIYNITSFKDLEARLIQMASLNNIGAAIRIQGKFDYIRYGGADKQLKPYKNTLSDALKNRPIEEKENVKGTLVGFWYPEYFGVMNVLGLHLHFISDTKDFGGHLLDLKSSKLTAGIDLCSGYDIEIINTPEFTESIFDLTEGYTNN